MAKKRSTIKEVAALAGVSIATVSNVFSGSKPVNDDLRRRVERAAKDLNYQIDRAASQLRSGQARVVGVLVPDLDDVFFTSLVSRLEVMARKDGYDVIVTSSRDDVEVEKSRLRALLGWRPSGLVAIPCSDTIPDLLRDEAGSIPLVFADRVILSEAFADTVTIDNIEAGEMVADHLRQFGHRDVVIAASDLSVAPIRDRIQGVRNVFLQHGREPTVVELGSNAERGAEIFANWLEANSVPSAIFGLTNVTTLSVLAALARHHIDVPEQSALVGFDDYVWMSARKVPLTAVRQPIDAMAQAIWQRLRIRMAGELEEPHHTVLNVSLQARNSVRQIGSDPLHSDDQAIEEKAGYEIHHKDIVGATPKV
ncbi:LacI family DNA-binding transcriptional regulator [uncultured Rhizobium sp.]|uniref:LacI family DNA-binding transcriptional regulator n=1 Tax=Neorhizobium sp. DAR64872/K0K18 TaxID=3421958 RepID=UPI002D7ED792|nr:LacI family DNA-binding transcriptional regulator [uncultured Rhizobium sp.]